MARSLPPLIVLANSENSALVGTPDLLAAFADFLNIDVGAGDASEDTLRTYRRQVQQFLLWCDRGNLNPTQITARNIKQYRAWLVQEKGFKPATVALKLSVVRRFYQAAVEHRLIAVNPALGIKPPRERRDPADRITYLEKAEVEHLIHSLPETTDVKNLRDKTLLAILAIEGPRTVEMHRANIADVVRQGHNWGIRVEGKRSIRVVPLTTDLAQLLQAYLDAREEAGEKLRRDRPLFIAVGNRAGGQRLSRRGIRLVVDRHLRETQLKHQDGRTISAHSLRHTAGTLALRAGAELRQVQDLLGHADPRTTCIYAHVADRWDHNPAMKVAINLSGDLADGTQANAVE